MAVYSSGISLAVLSYQVVLFAIGSTLMRSASCVLDDICNIDFDSQVGELASVI
jgi:4-hydroxybenzoate polyprenyltransferase